MSLIYCSTKATQMFVNMKEMFFGTEETGTILEDECLKFGHNLQFLLIRVVSTAVSRFHSKCILQDIIATKSRHSFYKVSVPFSA